jgi:hypothetical protein
MNIKFAESAILAQLQLTGLNLYKSKELRTEIFSIDREKKGTVKSIFYSFNTQVIIDGAIENIKVSKSSDVEGLILTKEGQKQLQILKECEEWVEGKPLNSNWRVDILHYEYRDSIFHNSEEVYISGANIQSVKIYPEIDKRENCKLEVKVVFTDKGFTHTVYLHND